MARYANCGVAIVDDNSQAEGIVPNANHLAGASAQNPHYENIYESIDQFAAAAAAGPAVQPNQSHPTGNSFNRVNAHNPNQRNALTLRSMHSRNVAYDIPRQRSAHPSNTLTTNRRIPPNFETLTTNRPRHTVAPAAGRYRQRSFDDTESFHYACERNMRYENIYEQIREEPIYRNASMDPNRSNRQTVGRLGVIGHGIGRINYHLSSSCGNIDHFNIGNHYAIMGHSHLGAVGHIRLNATDAATKAKETPEKSVNFFSCLGRENSQSMSNICADTNPTDTTNATAPMRMSRQQTVEGSSQGEVSAPKNGGAIPKVKTNKSDSIPPTLSSSAAAAAAAAAAAVSQPPQPSPSIASTSTNSSIPIHSTALNRISKSSLQWLLVNKWLPLWVGNGADCNVLDFNFMFSHKCNECYGPDYNHDPNAIYGNAYDDSFNANGYRNFPSHWPQNELGQMDGGVSYRRLLHQYRMNELYARNGNNGNGYEVDHQLTHASHENENPFRQWELNSENNSFRPAPIRRITDGTFPQNASANQSNRVPAVNGHRPNDQPSCSYRNSGQASYSAEETVKTADDAKKLVFSPDLSARRYSENTEDDQYKNSHSTDDNDDDDSLNGSDIESNGNLDSNNA